MVDKLRALLIVLLCLPLFGAWPNTGKKYPTSITGYTGPGDVLASATAWYGLRAYTNALANAGPTTTPVLDVRGSSTTTSCTIYLKGDGTGALDLTTAGAGGLGNQCLLGATTFCTVTNPKCTVSKLYDQTAGNHCASASCDVAQATVAQQPTLVFSAIGANPAISFKGPSTEMGTANNFTAGAGTSPMFCSWTGESTNNSAQQTAWGSSGGGTQCSYDLGGSTPNTTFIYSGNTGANATASDGSFHNIQGQFSSGSTSVINVDGSETTGLTDGNMYGTNTAFIGSTGGAGFLSGTLGEVGLWRATTTNSTQRNALCHNQSVFWGVASC